MFSSNKKKKTTPAVEAKKIEIAAATQFPKQWLHGTGPTQLITGFSDYIDATRLAHTCRFLYHDTKNPLNVRKLKALAHYVVVEPNEDKVTAILTGDSTLINVVIKEIIDNSGRTLINNTIFQLAYGAGDDEMCLAIKPFYIAFHGSEEAAIHAMERQRTEKFTEDKAADERQDKEAEDHTQHLLTTAIDAIAAEQFNQGRDADSKLILSPATLAAIETFRDKFAESQPKRTEKGMHFRNNTLLETLHAYVQAQVQWDYDYNRRALFEDGILSCVLFYAAANDAQRFSQGLNYLQNKGEKFTRTLALREGKNNFYLACRGKSLDFSLSGSCVDIYGGEGSHRWRGDVSGALRGYQLLCQTKTSNLQSLCDLSSHARRLAV